VTISPHAVFLARAHRAFSHSCDKSPAVAIIPSASKAVPLWLRYAVTGCETVGSDLLSFSRAGVKAPPNYKSIAKGGNQ
jgi:hypothetical protein